jgi:hypothetical protein
MDIEHGRIDDPDGTLNENRTRLDEALRKYVAENLDRKGVVTGWVLCIGTSRFDDDGHLLQAHDYSVGPDTNLPLSIGLVQLALWEMKKDVLEDASKEA